MAQEIISFEKLCELYGGTYSEEKESGWWGQPKEVYEVDSLDDYYALVQALRNLKEKGFIPEIPWLKDYTECETYLDPDYDAYVAKCEADIPEPLVDPDNLETAINSLADVVEQAEI